MHLHVRGSQADHAEWIANPSIASAAVYFTDENAVFLDRDGSMWIGTSGGLTHVLKPEKLIETKPLDLRIGLATLGATELDSDRRQSLKWSRGPALDRHLKDLDFGESSKAFLNVRLRGLSDDRFQTRYFNMHYPGLAPGSYTFEAIAVDTDHQRTSPLVHLTFEIMPPWWQTTWFRVVVVTLACGILAGAWRWSVLRLHARRRVLERELKAFCRWNDCSESLPRLHSHSTVRRSM
jgi:hypothetical protein